MPDSFDREDAKKFLEQREKQKKEEQETERKILLKKIIEILKEEFQNTSVEVYLVGSLTRPHAFSEESDVDIVLKNYMGDRFDIWTQLEKKIGKSVEIILFEQSHFQEFILSEGIKVV